MSLQLALVEGRRRGAQQTFVSERASDSGRPCCPNIRVSILLFTPLRARIIATTTDTRKAALIQR